MSQVRRECQGSYCTITIISRISKVIKTIDFHDSRVFHALTFITIFRNQQRNRVPLHDFQRSLKATIPDRRMISFSYSTIEHVHGTPFYNHRRIHHSLILKFKRSAFQYNTLSLYRHHYTLGIMLIPLLLLLPLSL